MWPFGNENKAVAWVPEVKEKEPVRPTIRKMEAVEDSDEALDSPVISEAREMLGYDPHAVSGKSLREALSRAGVEVFKRGDVDNYKDWMRKQNGQHAWKHVPIKEYFAPIPLFALSQAVAIKKELPECEIFVEYFGTDPDPFMAVLHRNNWYYFAAWDEPKFEGRATV